MTVTVLDEDTERPITYFRYHCRIDAPGARRPWEKGEDEDQWHAVRSRVGTFSLRAPASCRISVWVKAPAYLGAHDDDLHTICGTPPDRTADFTRADGRRELTVWLTRGAVVRGTVRDAATLTPVAGAKVACGWFAKALVRTDQKGTFTVDGLSSDDRLRVTHPRYLTADVESVKSKQGEDRPGQATVEVLLRSAPSLAGRVSAPDGSPLAGVAVWSGDSGSEVKSGHDGCFAITFNSKPRRDESYIVSFSKPGYVDRTLELKKLPGDELSVVLEPGPILQGRVLSPDGTPVRKFTIDAGLGENPRYPDETAEVNDPKGRWRLALQRQGRHWLGVRVEGFAPWEGWIDVARENGPVTIHLQSGVTVSGKVEHEGKPVPEALVFLVLKRQTIGRWGIDDTAACDLTWAKTKTQSDGSFRLPHVRPGRYLLRARGRTIAPIDVALNVPSKPMDLGDLEPGGTGRIVGQVEPFERGEITWGEGHGSRGWFEEIDFVADENGKYVVEGVPTGDVRVKVNEMVRRAQVLKGRTTQCRFVGSEKGCRVPIEFVVGDGTAAQLATGGALARKNTSRGGSPFENPFTELSYNGHTAYAIDIGLRPAPGKSLSYGLPIRAQTLYLWTNPAWLRTAADETAFSMVEPGKYWIRVSQGPALIHESRIEVPAKQPIRIPLRASSISGRVDAGKKAPKAVEELFGADHTWMVAAVEDDGKVRPRLADCNCFGYFCLAYLPSGRYTVYAHHEKLGWCRSEKVELGKAATRDLALPPFRPGGTVTGRLLWRSERRIPNRITATDANGVAVSPSAFINGRDTEEYVFNGLWPGRWVVTVFHDDEELSRAEVTLRNTEAVSKDIRGH